MLKVTLSEIPISLNNKLIYAFKQESNKIIEIVNVCFNIKYKKNWIAILRYDNYHGYMHRHTLISLDDKTETIDTKGVKQKGTNKRLLSWAINDIKNNYIHYKKKVILRSSKKINKKISIDFY